jgi:hypothetical protein
VASTPESLQSQKRSIRQNRLSLKGLRRFSRTTKYKPREKDAASLSREDEIALAKRIEASQRA